eukprot:EG_transcript_22415
MNAFVNTAGGVLLFGVDADGAARGLVVDRLHQALLQRTVANIFQAFRPPVPPEAFEVGFWPLYDRATGRPTGRVVVAVLIVPTGLVHNYMWRIYVREGEADRAVDLPEDLQALKTTVVGGRRKKPRVIAGGRRGRCKGTSWERRPTPRSQMWAGKAQRWATTERAKRPHTADALPPAKRRRPASEDWGESAADADWYRSGPAAGAGRDRAAGGGGGGGQYFTTPGHRRRGGSDARARRTLRRQAQGKTQAPALANGLH